MFVYELELYCGDKVVWEAFGQLETHLKTPKKGFPGGAVVKNPLASAGDTGSSPDPGRSHMLRSN